MGYNFTGFYWKTRKHSSLSIEQHHEAELKARTMLIKGKYRPKVIIFRLYSMEMFR
ncbi:hypothetical protein [Vibrio sonorensis]|uniref:hypothetical protein n=1 Tax=Vibrio sonorensis TaxID=1004316 RepID=UPI001585F3DC|nr:hypothetical protein [Vibrio sonorensis]